MTVATKQRTRHELIIILLESYEDVLNGLRDHQGNGEHIPLMCAAYNTPAYQQLIRQLHTMRTHQPSLYWHLAETYIRPVHRKAMQCPHCHRLHPAWNHPGHHTHGRRHVQLVPRIIRQPRTDVNPTTCHQATTWLDHHWHGTITLPKELQHLAA